MKVYVAYINTWSKYVFSYKLVNKSMSVSRIIVWFRRDLRLHDNEALHQAILSSESVIPVYIFDDYELKEDAGFGFSKQVHIVRSF